jgi:signal transduction histidine kinase/DNA-binding response OmpR family regulator
VELKSVIHRYIEWGNLPDDSEDEKLKKSSLLVMAGPFAAAGLGWGLLYFSNGLIFPGLIPFIYGLLSLASLFVFGFNRKYKIFRNSQLFLILILPFALQLSLGGFIPSSAIIYWSLIAPAGAMFFDNVKRSLYWFASFILLVCIAYLVNDMVPSYVEWNLTEDFINMLFLMNIFGVSGLMFGILYYSVSKIKELKTDIEIKNKELKEQSDKLKELDKIKSRFFANISHEFRTPLTLILGLINKQVSNIKSPPDPTDINTMNRNAQRLLQLINQLLDLSKLESGEVKLNATKGDFVQFAKTLTAQFESMASGKRIHLTFNDHLLYEKDSLPQLEFYFDREKLQKILTNLLSNAIKFTPDEGSVEVKVIIEPELVGISIMNSGQEIPADKLPRIFERFYQVDGSTNRQFEGTGIGLALVKELMELHHGFVTAESKNGYNTFTVRLPLKTDYLREDEKFDASPLEIETFTEETNQVSEPVTGNEKIKIIPEKENDSLLEILIVEDNNDLRTFIKDMLQPEYKVLDAANGVEGFEIARVAVPDLIISDIMMPGMDGYELCEKLKTNYQTDHIPVILLTARAAREDKLEGLETGADDYLVKPFDEKELMARIRNLISIREKLQKKFRSALWLKPREINVTSRYQKFLDDLKEVIEKNMENELFSVDDLGKAMAMSRSQIHRKLKALTGQPVTTFIRNYRLHRAADLLIQNAGNVTEIAYMVGFNSQTYFSSSFQELFGCSPSDYRQKTVKSA